MPDDFSTIFEAPLDQPPTLDELVRATMAWHFSPSTGSPYWTSRVADLGFDPLTDVRGAEDLALFDGVTVDWATIPAQQLIPRGSRPETPFGVFESGGTTGAPKRIVDADSRRRNIEYQSSVLDLAGFPHGEGGWLHVGPTGPHVMAKNVGNLATMRGFLRYFVDLDPRWAKRCVAEGRQDDFNRYVSHILDQVRDVLATQDIRAISSTPPILAAMAARPDVYEPLRAKVRGIVWGGTSVDAETLRLLEEEVFPDAVIQGAYGNTMMGMAPQRPRRDGDPAPCIFRPFYPYTVVELVDPQYPDKPVDEGVEGRVKVTTLTRDLFVPPTLERDACTRRTPIGHPTGIELSGVRPADTGGPAIVEGVY
ncbi:MAG TPA: phenazine antibiotic biosynthesis protein [Actinophytocola sp.]|uniref:phenazine antibiotic biosynthesis protein n=1 Tax=Actinophytocola sp. TaxID=1872138 RepID=UPI002DDD38DD|nr:phenazine antibiotic biosynthesis protein [Actinophytocola sp.]HEV2778120.1 phenazine antibiotic biosynthesis protein [Actinophytocola sp.]